MSHFYDHHFGPNRSSPRLLRGPAGRVNLPVLIKIAPFVALCVLLSPVLGTSLCSADSEGQNSGGNGGVKHYFLFLFFNDCAKNNPLASVLQLIFQSGFSE